VVIQRLEAHHAKDASLLKTGHDMSACASSWIGRALAIPMVFPHAQTHPEVVMVLDAHTEENVNVDVYSRTVTMMKFLGMPLQMGPSHWALCGLLL
jgi:hypothetical protein